ncbi:hypothetical protein DNO_1033 [Dichelobacter nodosus VCS1703A]|uniref:Uncharacterized protein n=1 Tax=Dichelobacter nodosus (strain VCS1703A) TaxID=246195 RepID=A5EXW3_DICNV|nr:hypothetical protein DNO_1033 [Dichelobacter nodosus VCS1703A]
MARQQKPFPVGLRRCWHEKYALFEFIIVKQHAVKYGVRHHNLSAKKILCTAGSVNR